MPESPRQLTLPQLLEVRERFEMGDGLFREITGIEVSRIFAYRRGKLKERPGVGPEAVARINRCEEFLRLAIELTGNQDKALDWLYAESPTFGGRSPIDLTINDAAAEVVRGYISKLRAAVSSKPPTPAEAFPTRTSPVSEPAPPLARVPAPSRPAALRPSSKNAVPAEKSIQNTATSTNLPQPTCAPPSGVLPSHRIFRLKEPLAEIRAARPDLTLKRISEMMTERGYKQFASGSYMSRLANSYTWATWDEVVALADALGVSPRQLGSVYTPQ